MDGKHQQHSADAEQNAAELLPRNPYCSNCGTHYGCTSSQVTFQPQWVTAKPWSLWKTFLVCLLACLIATALVVLVLYFVPFGKHMMGTTVVIHTDGKSAYVTCIPGSTLSPAPIPCSTASPAPITGSTPSPTPITGSTPSPTSTLGSTPSPATSPDLAILPGSQSTRPPATVPSQSSPTTQSTTSTSDHEVEIEDDE